MSAITFRPSAGTRSFRLVFLALAGLLLAVPLVAMQFTGEVNWGPGDFIVMGAMLALLGTGIDIALRLPASFRLRAALAGLAIAGFLLVWAELAVGIFD
ncbi:hypothetical protein OIK40_02080 [Erythrobacter sp. sf7]|uniref:Uncharacterized protein n=1 Tax=Erythrobacter fulvus TaxID=2987523 RepID=A0ABT5JLN2_9SPHN|nr:hypothetical protein [Erythrobacter fulvus]MDC8753426.1 hypothetical protein [Erythrobacter fulvus]